MHGIHKLNGAANTMQAREDYRRLTELARQAGRPELVSDIPSTDKGWRSVDAMAKAGVANLLKYRPDLREQLKAIYPGFVG